MKIVQVTNSYKPAWQTGGVCRVAYDVSSEMYKRKHDVSVIATNLGSESKVIVNKWVDVDGIKVIYYRNWAPANLVGKMPLPLCSLYRGMDVISEADVVHIHDYRSFLSIVVSRICIKKNIPYIIQMHGAFSHRIGNGGQKRMFDKMFGKKMIANASKLIALTRTEADEIIRSGVPKDKIKIIPNGIDWNIYSKLPSIGDFRGEMAIPPGHIILYLGRLDKTKGIDLLLMAFASQFAEREDIILVIIGHDDGERQHLEKLALDLGIEKRILFFGFVDAAKKLAALVDSDLVVCPSYSGFPITILEACACGKPIVTTTKGDDIDFLDGRVGLKTEYNVASLGEGLRSLLGDKERMRRLGESGRVMVKNEFSIVKVGTMMLDIYDDICRQRKNTFI